MENKSLNTGNWYQFQFFLPTKEQIYVGAQLMEVKQLGDVTFLRLRYSYKGPGKTEIVERETWFQASHLFNADAIEPLPTGVNSYVRGKAKIAKILREEIKEEKQQLKAEMAAEKEATKKAKKVEPEPTVATSEQKNTPPVEQPKAEVKVAVIQPVVPASSDEDDVPPPPPAIKPRRVVALTDD